jgi:hypothetical protein
MVFGAKALCAGVLLCAGVATASARPADFSGAHASADARHTAQWVLDSRDAKGRPFAIVDKKDARLYVFGADGRLAGASPALLGLAPGDHAVPGLGNRAPGGIQPHERTTPAGRFASAPGRNLSGEPVIWFDYREGLAIHRLRPAPAHERRAQRLASPTPHDNRISLGCVIVPVAFYESVVQPTLGARAGVVYVLPETRSARELFDTDS